jgi:hypothetical protein
MEELKNIDNTSYGLEKIFPEAGGFPAVEWDGLC